MLRIALGLAVLVFPAPALAQELWQGARAGMTPEEVVETVDGASASDGAKEDNLTLDVVRPGLEIAGRSWTAGFYFAADGLQRVTIRLDEAERSAASGLFQPTLTDLREIYGEPFACEVGQFGQSCEWRWPDRKIELSLFDALGVRSLGISYSKREGAPPKL